MAIVKRKRGDGSTSYAAVVYEGGKHIWLGTCDTRSEAKELLATRPARGNSRPFHSFAEEWLETGSHIAASTKTRYTFAVNIAIARFGDTPLSEIDARECERYMAYLTNRYAPGSANVHFDVFSSLLKTAHAYGYCDEPKLVRNRPPRRGVREIHPLTPDEHRALVVACNKHYAPLVELWPLLGLRSCEMFALHKSDVSDGVLDVRRALKTPSARRKIPLTARAQEILAGMESPLDLVCVNTLGRPVTSGVFRAALKIAARDAKLETVRPHDLRHTFATWMIYSGANVKTLQNLLGHKTAQETLNRYSHFMPLEDARSVDALTDWLANSLAEESEQRG